MAKKEFDELTFTPLQRGPPPETPDSRGSDSNSTTLIVARSLKKLMTRNFIYFSIILNIITFCLFLAVYFNFMPTINDYNNLKNEKDKSSALHSLCIREFNETEENLRIQTLNLNHCKFQADSLQKLAAERTAQLGEAQASINILNGQIKNLRASNDNLLRSLHDKVLQLEDAVRHSRYRPTDVRPQESAMAWWPFNAGCTPSPSAFMLFAVISSILLYN